MPQFEISNLVLDIVSDDHRMVEGFIDFSAKRNRDPDLRITLKCQDYVVAPHEKMIFHHPQVTWHRQPVEEKGYILYTGGVKKVIALAEVDCDWEICNVVYQADESTDYKRLTHFLMGIIFRNTILRHEGIVIHSSSIEWNGKGIMFSAPSETGKSTHARLWQEYMGDRVVVLNDDSPAVRLKEGKPFVFGTPWSGTSNIHRNLNSPLEAIVLLEQAPENSIQQLPIADALQKFMPRVFLPYYDMDMMSLALTTLDKIISSVPTYLLKCRPDQEAVELVYQCVK